MSTWQIFFDDDRNFRWESSTEGLEVKSKDEPDGVDIENRTSNPRFPSMADLLLQGCSKLLENRNEGVENPPMFRTGSGKSVALKQSSVKKALSILVHDDATETVRCTGQVHTTDDACTFSNSAFQTGSGKMVNISSEGLMRAKALLGFDEDNNESNFQQARKPCNTNEPFLEAREREGNKNNMVRPRLFSKTFSVASRLEGEVNPFFEQSELENKALKPPPVKFHTAGGRSISVSSDALQRARSLLGDPDLGNFLNEGDADDMVFTRSKERRVDDKVSSNNGNDFHTPSSLRVLTKSNNTSKSFLSPLKSSSNVLHSSFKSENVTGCNLINQFDTVEHDGGSKLNTKMPSSKLLGNKTVVPSTSEDSSFENSTAIMRNTSGRSSGGPLTDISNTIGTACKNNTSSSSENRRFWRTSYVSPFKRPRISEFSAPLNKNAAVVSNGVSALPSESCFNRRVSSRYPNQASRMYVKEFFGVPLSDMNRLECLSDEVRRIKSENSEKYVFRDNTGLNCIGVEAFLHMLADSGASMQWVTNHYKWIVWKLACYERCYPAKLNGKFLTVPNVLEELKYRYEREVNRGHRSAIKRILEGDAPPSSLVVLCVSAIYLNGDSRVQNCSVALDGFEKSGAKVELTDGWYAVDAFLDGLLLKQLALGKLFVGQKLRIWGARLCGWVGPVSTLEVPETVSLVLHINGTYRAHWADRLGFCKNIGAPLSFRCIKSSGGPVPWTLAGVTRIYPVLYKERLSDGGSVVRSERMETKMSQLFNHRRYTVIDGVVSESQRAITGSRICNENNSEGAKIFKLLESAAEPEVIMAAMSPEQLTSFSTYRAKVEAIRQSEMEKSIEKALADAGLSERDVTPFMRVRVVGLTSKNQTAKRHRREGLITIWNPTEKQRHELVEGRAYGIAGLVPINCEADILYLQGKGSTTKWQALSSQSIDNFEPFFSPRKSILLSNLGQIPLSSEFDIAAVVVYVGEVFAAAHQKKQWVFVTDGSTSDDVQSEQISNSLLAINFCSRYTDDVSFVPINSNLTGSSVGFCNLLKRAKDCMNHLWVAEATENSSYFPNLDSLYCSHLKNAGVSAQRWANASGSGSTIEKLREKILFITGDGKD